MKKVALSIFVFIFAVGIFAQENDADKEVIKKVVKSAYVDGLQNYGDVDKIDAGFHPGFNLLGVNENNSLWKYPIYSWKEAIQIKVDKGKLPRSEDQLISCEFPLVDITGNAAMVKIELYEEENKIFTDYLSLYKIDGEWKIVNKIFHSHK